MMPVDLGFVFLATDLAAELQAFGRRLVSGIVVGSILALAGVGLTLVYGILRLANFAHGDFLTLGAYVALYFVALIALPATQTWAVAVALLLVAIVAADHFLGPWIRHATGRVTRPGRQRLLSRAEAWTVLFAAFALIALAAGTRVRPDVPGGVSALIVALPVAAAIWGHVASRDKDALVRGLPVAAALGAAAATVAHFVVPLQTGAAGWGLPAEAAMGLAVLAALGLRRTRDVGQDVLVLVVSAAAALFGLFLLASPILLAVVLSLAAVATLSVLLELVMWRPARRKGAGLVTLIIMAIGLALVVRNMIRVFWGGDLQGFPGAIQRAEPIFGTGVTITPNQAIVVGTTLLVVLLLHLLLQHTKMGRAMRALSDNMDLARVSGVDVDRVVLYVWIIGGVLVALAGVLYGMTRSFTPDLGWHQLLPIFAAVILGGIGSAYGALVGGFAIGIAMETSVYFGVPPEYRIAVGFAILILVMIVRPRGIFGRAAVR